MLFDVWLVSRATTGLLDAALAPSGLTADEFGVYSVLTSAEAHDAHRARPLDVGTADDGVRATCNASRRAGHVERSATPTTAGPTCCASPSRPGRARRRRSAASCPALEAVVAARRPRNPKSVGRSPSSAARSTTCSGPATAP